MNSYTVIAFVFVLICACLCSADDALFEAIENNDIAAARTAIKDLRYAEIPLSLHFFYPILVNSIINKRYEIFKLIYNTLPDKTDFVQNVIQHDKCLADIMNYLFGEEEFHEQFQDALNFGLAVDECDKTILDKYINLPNLDIWMLFSSIKGARPRRILKLLYNPNTLGKVILGLAGETYSESNTYHQIFIAVIRKKSLDKDPKLAKMKQKLYSSFYSEEDLEIKYKRYNQPLKRLFEDFKENLNAIVDSVKQAFLHSIYAPWGDGFKSLEANGHWDSVSSSSDSETAEITENPIELSEELRNAFDMIISSITAEDSNGVVKTELWLRLLSLGKINLDDSDIKLIIGDQTDLFNYKEFMSGI